MIFEPIINAAIALVGAIITAVLMPYIRTKISAEKLKQIATVIEYAVKAAEQIYDEGDVKKAYVLHYLIEQGYIKDMTNVTLEIDNLIESAVYELKK